MQRATLHSRPFPVLVPTVDCPWRCCCSQRPKLQRQGNRLTSRNVATSAAEIYEAKIEEVVETVNMVTETTSETTASKRRPWNKGLKMEEAVKDKIRASLKGRVPWNKGRKMSAMTRKHMQIAKLGTVHSIQTRRKMSVAHTGKTLSPETMKTLSQKLSGMPKSEEHKKKIAASQRKRIAANKALKAIENVHKQEAAIHGDQQTSLPRALTPYFSQSADRKKLSREKKTRAEVLRMYKALLREYRQLQSDLSPWMEAFKAKNGRKPRLVDVEATQIPWLVSNFKHYLLLRDKLLRDIPYLRKAMVAAPEDATVDSYGSLTDSDSKTTFETSSGMGDGNTASEAEESSQASTWMGRMETIASGTRVSNRVKSAMAAAIEYKRNKVRSPTLSAGSIDMMKGSSDKKDKSKEIAAARSTAMAAMQSLHRAEQECANLSL